ncbi:MAG: pyrroline-5-carboxylate reductase dimerization domain-containing protein [Pseudomonadota bacterium]
MTTIGIIGVGHLTQFMIEGWMSGESGKERPTLILSPRNAARSAALASTFGLEVGASNQDVVDQSEIVVLAVRPPDMMACADEISFRPDQTVISVAAGVLLSDLAAHVAPAQLIRALPVTSAGVCYSPTPLFPANPAAEDALSKLGPVHVLDSEAAFDAATVLGVYYGWVQAFIERAAAAGEQAGLSPELARAMAADMTAGSASLVKAQTDQSVAEMVAEIGSPGSYTGMGLDLLRERGAMSALDAALDAVLARLKTG